MTKKTIKACDGTPYLTRWVLFRLGSFALFLHKFHISDEVRAQHDHPWSFVSLILWPGYIEHTPGSASRKFPGMILFRPAEWLHRVELLKKAVLNRDPVNKFPKFKYLVERPAWTLVFHFRRRRKWGFNDPSKGWTESKEWHKSNGCVEED